MGNVQNYIALTKESVVKITGSTEKWLEFLDLAARLYKYPFQDQLLIYAQRPDATACASMEVWNQKMNCWVNKGAKGIALIDENAPYIRLKYVFDVSDVHKARKNGRDPYLWVMQEKHMKAILNSLEEIHGSIDKEKTFENRIIEIAERMSLDYFEKLPQT